MSSDILGEKIKNILKSHNWNRQLSEREPFSSTEYDFKGQISLLYFRLLDFKGSNVCFVFSLGLVLHHRVLAKYPRIGFPNPHLTPELWGLVFKAFANLREGVGDIQRSSHSLPLPNTPHPKALSPSLKKEEGKERERSRRES